MTSNTALYSAPGTLSFDALAQLSRGTEVTLIAAYGEFVQVQTELSGGQVTGFVPAELIDGFTTNLATLTVDQVPWPFIDTVAFADWKTGSYRDLVAIDNGELSNDNTQDTKFKDAIATYQDYNPLSVTGRFRADMQFIGQGRYGVMLLGRLLRNLRKPGVV